MAGAEPSPEAPVALDPRLDVAWLNDRSAYGLNFVHGLRNPDGLHIQYAVEPDPAGFDPASPDSDPLFGHRVVGGWIADENHMGFPGIAHGGLVGAILDDVIGRCAALRHRWVVTARLDVRFRAAAPVGVPLRIEGRLTRYLRRSVTGHARILLPDGTVVAEATGTYLPIPRDLLAQMVDAWPGFAAFVDLEDEPG